MRNQFDELINYEVKNLGYKNPLYIADNSSKYWKDFWNIFESKFSQDFIFNRPTENEFQERKIYLEAINNSSLTKNLFILSLPEGHMKTTKGNLLSRLTFLNKLFKEYIRKNLSIFFITFYAPLKNELNLDFVNSIVIISGLKEIWSSSEKYGQRLFTILENINDESAEARSIQINFTTIRDLLLNKIKPIIQKEIIFDDNDGQLFNKNKAWEKKPKDNECYNLLRVKDWDSAKQILIESNNKFIAWIKNCKIEDFIIDEVKNIEVSRKFSKTEKEVLIKARIGQGWYRKELLKIFQKCPITKIDDEKLLIASHIKPWADAKHDEKLDPNNGILLSALFDKLFDQGLITFSDDGKIIFSKRLTKKTKDYLSSLNENEQYELELNDERKRYLVYHRKKWKF